MSISYFGVATDDPQAVGPIFEGTHPNPPPIPEARIREELLRLPYLDGPPNGTLKWENEGSYILVDVFPYGVEITHDTHGDSLQMEVVMEVIDVVQRQGLKVWDPQQGSWFPGG